MARGSKPAKHKDTESPVARKSAKNDDTRVRDLEKRLAEALRDKAEAREQQTATAEILRVIGSSPTDVQPVFDKIAMNAVRVCDAAFCVVFREGGGLVHLVAHHNFTEEGLAEIQQLFPVPLQAPQTAARLIVSGKAVHITDVLTDERISPGQRRVAEVQGYRGYLGIPMLRDGNAIGAIAVARREVGLFSESQVELLQTFAAQAVIAIENVRLFNETKIALERQTATSEILRVISSSPADAQPVFDSIVQSGMQLLDGYSATMMLLRDDGILHLVAHTSTSAEADALLVQAFPLPLRSLPPGERAVQERRAHAVEDVATASDVTDVMRETGRTRGWRSNLFVPMLRDDIALGLISITRRDPGPFGADQVALLETFADQAVIAIENVRLFTELQEKNKALTTAHTQVSESLEQQTATAEVLQVISGSPTDVRPVFDAILASAVRLCHGNYGGVYLYDGQFVDCVALHNVPPEAAAYIARTHPRPPMGMMTLALHERRIMHSADVVNDPRVASARQDETTENIEVAQKTRQLIGFNAIVIAPMLREGTPIGVIVVTRREGGFSSKQLVLLQTFANQAVIAIENVRLFKELEAANRGLAAASQHKSEFLANMSHELRTPLNAIIGFSEVLTDRMFGELNEKQEEYLKDIYASGTHLLSLINDILDLSKIEAGRMELELTEFDLPTAIENALMLVRERAGRRSIALETHLDERLGQVQADERKVRQVVLNLLSNAIKFTPEGGRIDVGVAPKDGFVEVSVSDTGIGIAPEDQEKVFEEFRQVGTAAKKIEGTGLGLTLCRKFVDLHGGRIWVKSVVGEGSTFTFTIPVRRGD